MTTNFYGSATDRCTCRSGREIDGSEFGPCPYCEREADERKFACGLGPDLPPGDTYYFEAEGPAYHKADCPGCNPGGPKPYGTPISQLSGRPGHPGFNEFCRIARSWGYD